jgi:catechol 2,3-dioxygenase-like lactoylglutathione lyase family enzyme
MALEFTVGINIAGKHESVTVAAEDALIAALKVKCERPDALINYVRRRNKRGDVRHPHGSIAKREGSWGATLGAGMIESISAITLATHDMSRAVRFYRMLGFEVIYGGDDAAFTSFRAGTSYLNLIAQPAEQKWSWWGRVIFYHSDVDSLHASVIAAGYRPDTAPRDAEWGERFFHVTDPDGHELSFAKPLR